NRAGDVNRLQSLCKQIGIEFVGVPALELDGSPVSSSRVRRALLAGNVREAARLLGRDYSIQGVVGGGQRPGPALGFPTANLEEVQTLLPRDGVYAVRTAWDGRSWTGAANIGPNPTFGEYARKVEVHVLDFDGDLYGFLLQIAFLDRIRDTRPFAGGDDLVKQLRQDVEKVRTISR